MNVLLSGSHGLIGGALAAALTADGHGVVRLVRGDEDGPGRVRWDPGKDDVDRGALDRSGPYDAVVHLAGAGIGDRRWSTRRMREIRTSRVASTRLVARLVATMVPVPGVVVSASAVGLYGDRGDEVLTEESTPGTGFLADVCRAWEEAAAPVGDVTRLVVLRSGVVLSGEGGALAKQLPLFRLGLGGRLGSGRQFVSWITLDDEVAVIRRALDDPSVAGPVNACAPHPVRNAELTRALGRALHRPAALVVPGPALSVALGRGLAHELLLAGQRAVPACLERLGHDFSCVDIDGALASALGGEPSSEPS